METNKLIRLPPIKMIKGLELSIWLSNCAVLAENSVNSRPKALCFPDYENDDVRLLRL